MKTTCNTIPVKSNLTRYGFEFGAATVSRACSDDKKGWVMITLHTPKTDLQIYVTKSGKVRIHNSLKELK